MKSFMVCLNTIKVVQSFVGVISVLDSDFDLVSGRYIVDAKSIMGIFSLDLTSPIELKVHNCTDEIEDKIKDFLVK